MLAHGREGHTQVGWWYWLDSLQEVLKKLAQVVERMEDAREWWV